MELFKLRDLFGKESEERQKDGGPAVNPATPAGQPTATSAAAQVIGSGMVDISDLIAPSAIEVDFDFIKINNRYYRTLFVSGYPRFVGANWLSPVINFDHSLDISMFCYPIESKGVLSDLKRKITEMEVTIGTDLEHGRPADPATKLALEDAQALQDQLVKGTERFFQFSLYVTIPGDTKEELDTATKQVEATLGSLLIISKHATLQMEPGFLSTLPVMEDKLLVTRNMDTTSLATTFPFTSSELTANEGILYGLNEHNGSLVIFDRFTLENANAVVFAKSGSGKSYTIKLEALRSLMFGTEIIVIDPENEYIRMAQAIGGEVIEFSYASPAKINPFELPGIPVEGENELGLKILSLHSLFRVMLGNLTPTEDAILDRSLIITYKNKGITPDPATQKNEPPLLNDLYQVLREMPEPDAKVLAEKLERFTKGSVSGIFDQSTSINLQNPFTVFSIKNLEDSIRPIAMFIILDYIWTRIKRDQRKRLLVVDEAWYLMRHPDSATFMYSIAKRARKYYLGLTTITQDVDDFLSSDYGKAIVTNSSIQILMKQSTAAIDKIGEVFYLSEGEKKFLQTAEVGEGLFFAGQNHVAIRVQASPEEHQLITTNPAELAARAALQGNTPLIKPNAPHTTEQPLPAPMVFQNYSRTSDSTTSSLNLPSPPSSTQPTPNYTSPPTFGPQSFPQQPPTPTQEPPTNLSPPSG
jgi:type IV secretory pathway VirB4 component